MALGALQNEADLRRFIERELQRPDLFLKKPSGGGEPGPEGPEGPKGETGATGPEGASGVTLFDAKGDILVGKADNEPQPLAVGADGLALVADSAKTLGAKWAAPAPAAHTHPESDVTGLVADLASKQPLDSDLTAIAALSTTAYGRELLTLANAAAGRTALELGSAAVEPASRFPQTAVLTSKVGPIKEQTAFQDITGLSLAIGASATERWLIRMYLLVEAANATMDCKFTFSVPEGLTGKWGCLANSATTTSIFGGVPTGTTPTLLGDPTNGMNVGTAEGIIGVAFVATFKGGGNAGTVQARYAQNTSNAGNLSILAGSVLEAVKVAN